MSESRNIPSGKRKYLYGVVPAHVCFVDLCGIQYGGQ
jgi:hypothetical protein